MSYSLKTIRVTITLGKGSFRGGGNTIIINPDIRQERGDIGLPIVVSVEKPGLPDKNSAKVKIVGLSLDAMQQITTLGFRALTNRNNTIQIEAGEQGKELSSIFEGEISFATADFNTAPDIAFEIHAESGSLPALIPAAPLSVQGVTSCENLIKQWAGEIGYNCKNEGVTASVKNSIFNGTAIEKAQTLAIQAGFELLIDDTTFLMMPMSSVRSGTTPYLSADTGLVGYPTLSEDGIKAKCLYMPELQQGGAVEIDSILPYASGVWKITRLTHSLAAFTDGDWFSEFDATWGGEDSIWENTEATER